MLAEIFFYGVVIYLIYKFIFDFVVPVSHAGKQMKQQFKETSERMQQTSNPYPPNQSEPKSGSSSSKNVVGDYIDFEEVKK